MKTDKVIKKDFCSSIAKQRLKTEILENFILELRSTQPMSKKDLIKILNRKKKIIRERGKKLTIEDKLGLLYPENPILQSKLIIQ